MGKINLDKKKQKINVVTIKNEKIDYALEDNLKNENPGDFIMKNLLEANEPEKFTLTLNQLFSEKNLIIMIKSYLQKQGPKSIHDFCSSFKIPLTYFKKLKGNIKNPKLNYLIDLLISEDEVKLWRQNDNATKVVQTTSAQFSLKARHGYSDSAKAGSSSSTQGVPSINISFTGVDKKQVDFINKLNENAKAVDVGTAEENNNNDKDK